MKRILITSGIISVSGIMFGFLVGMLRAQPSPGLALTQLSSHEFVDLSKISYFRPGYTIDLSSIGGDANYPISGLLVAGGAQVAISDEGAAKLKQLLGVSLTLSDISAKTDGYELHWNERGIPPEGK